MSVRRIQKMMMAAAMVATALLANTAQAGIYTRTLDVSAIFSNAELGDASNEVRFLDVGANRQVVGLAWNVTLGADEPSWLSEIGVDIGNGALNLTPGLGDNQSGAGSYSGSADLAAMSLDFITDASGMLRFEFFELFDDLAGADGVWRQGTLQVSLVPEPASLALVGLALTGMLAVSRRRGR